MIVKQFPRLEKDFYVDDDVVVQAQRLLGKLLVTHFDHQLTVGRIVETEAYRAPDDKACHAYNNRRTKRTEIMFREGGTAYITLCYGIHHLFNVVTGAEGMAQAVLIRAIEPIVGTTTMLERRGLEKMAYRVTAGPGALSKAMGITTDWHGSTMTDSENPIWLSDDGVAYAQKDIISGARVGIAYAEEWKDVPWRFQVKDSPWVSRAKGG
ncbi:MAG: DNA-3-methyladenine glycosylase [Bacteroidota bacterium]